MAYSLTFSGDLSAQPTGGGSGVASIDWPISEQVALQQVLSEHYDLAADAPVPVGLGGLTAVAVLALRATGGPVKVRVTSSKGNTQSLPLDPHLVLLCLSDPLTAIDLTRSPGVPTSVEVFLGQS